MQRDKLYYYYTNNLKQMMRRDAGMLPETVKFIIFCLLQVPDLTCPYLLFPFSIEVYIEEPPLDWPHEMNGVCAISILYGSVLHNTRVAKGALALCLLAGNIDI